MNPLQSLRDTVHAWNPFAAAEEVSPPPPPPFPPLTESLPGVSQWIPGLSAEEVSPPPPPPSPPPTESLPGVSRWIPGLSAEETPAPSSLPEPLAKVSEKVQGLLSNAWTSPHFEAFQGFGKKVCEYISPLVSDRAEEICADETNHTIAAVAVAALVSAVIAKTMLTAARAFSCRNKNLHMCIEAGSLYGVKKRLQKADVDSTSLFGETALILASRRGQVAIVGHLLKTADPNIQAGRTGDTALHAAIRAGQNQVIPLLLGKADVNKQNAKGQTPIMLAVETGNDFAIEALAKQPGIKWDAKDVEGNTVLHYVARKKFSQVILNKSDANIANKKGELPLHTAVGNHGFDRKNVSALAAKTRDAYAEDQDGKTSFVRALERGNEFVAKDLLDKKKVVTAANSDIVGLALKRGLTPSQLFDGIHISTLKKIKPEGFDLPTFAAIYGLENCLEYLTSKKLFFQDSLTRWNSRPEKLIRHLLENPHFLARITTRKYNVDSLLQEIDNPHTTAFADVRDCSIELDLLCEDARHYLQQLEREHDHLASEKGERDDSVN